jgi:RimJ/RimL family protein N-acetyltransferase
MLNSFSHRPTGRYTDVSQVEAWITGHQDNPEGFTFMIDLNESKDSKSLPRTIGSMSTPAFPQPESHQKSVREIGFMLRPDEWGKGFATEAASAVVKTIFEKTDITHLTARTDEANRGSWNVLEKSGFKRVDRQEYENVTLGKRIIFYYEIARPGYRIKGEQEKDTA